MIDSFDPHLDYNSKRRDNSICSLLRLYGQATAFSHIASDLVFVEAWSNIFESVCVPFSVGFSKISASLTSKFKSKIYCPGSLTSKNFFFLLDSNSFTLLANGSFFTIPDNYLASFPSFSKIGGTLAKCYTLSLPLLFQLATIKHKTILFQGTQSICLQYLYTNKAT